MEMNQEEVKVIEQAAQEMEQLAELQLALVGGGIVNVFVC
jgi:CHASE3 domain sensor protein